MTRFDRGLLALAGGLLFLVMALTGCGSVASLRLGQGRPELDAVQLGQQLVADQALLLRKCGDTERAIAELVGRDVRQQEARQRIGLAADAISAAQARPSTSTCPDLKPSPAPAPFVPEPPDGGVR